MNARPRSTLLFVLCLAWCSCSSTESESERAQRAENVLDITPGQALVVRTDASSAPGRVLHVRPVDAVHAPLGTDGNDGVLRIEGARNVTLDLSGVVLRGTPRGTDLDKSRGIGIVLRNCEDVTLQGGELGGYKVCIAAFACRGLVIDGVHFDGWYAKHLMSTSVAEDESDWLYPHKNDDGEWMRDYGAAIALNDCTNAVVRSSRGRHGQNGVLLTRCAGTRIYDDDFSFMSGWGLALYRTNSSMVAHDRFDYCVRGYSHDIYWRGQDSAGILLFERCSDNVFCEDSATHGGDGLFLFAGRDTVDGLAFARGEMDAGGSDRNILWGCDFSFAVANAIEATFSSDNWAIGNLLDGSHQHGVWGGYSRRMVVLGNSIRGTKGGAVSIEHGIECAIVENAIETNDTGVELWWDENPALVGGPFGQHRDCASRDTLVLGNTFRDNAQDLALRRTQRALFGRNEFASGTRTLRINASSVVQPEGEKPIEPQAFLLELGRQPSGIIENSSLSRAPSHEPEWLANARAWTPPTLPGSQKPFARDRGAPQGLDTIVMGEWGPWDFESGDPKPSLRRPGGLLSEAQWDATWFAWTPPKGATVDLPPELAAWRALAANPIATRKVGAWTNPWAGDETLKKLVGNSHFGLIASTRVTLQAGGKHRLAVTSDDGVRVLVDGKTAFEDWTWHAPKRGEVEIELAAGEHAFTLEYFQIDGAAALTVELTRASGD